MQSLGEIEDSVFERLIYAEDLSGLNKYEALVKSATVRNGNGFDSVLMMDLLFVIEECLRPMKEEEITILYNLHCEPDVCRKVPKQYEFFAHEVKVHWVSKELLQMIGATICMEAIKRLHPEQLAA